jgi:hypothetical protein
MQESAGHATCVLAWSHPVMDHIADPDGNEI